MRHQATFLQVIPALAVALGSVVSSAEAGERLTDPPMKTFDAMVAKHAPHQRMKGFVAAIFDHGLGSNAAVARALSRSGIPKTDIRWQGKSYSDHPGVIAEMRAEGFRYRVGERVSKCGFLPPLGDPSFVLVGDDRDAYARATLANAIKAAGNKNLLLVDDDGRFVQMMHTEFRDALPRTVAVSRTRRVSALLSAMKLEMPVVDMGQAWIKDVFESPSIGRSVGQATEEKVQKLRSRGVPVGQRVVLVGAGVVGLATARYLSERGFKVELHDKSESALRRAWTEGHVVQASLEAALPRAQILLSATGNNPVKPRHLPLLPNGALLVNGASGSYEVSGSGDQYSRAQTHVEGRYIYGMFLGQRVLLGDTRDPDSLDMILHPGDGKQLFLARDGRVINFNYGPTPHDPIPGPFIQITRGATYLASDQAVGLLGKPGGMYPMKLKPQRRYAAQVQEELRLSDQSLLLPDF